MDATPLNDIQTLNFTILSLVRDAARSDPALAACRFGLTARQLKTISELTPADVLDIVERMGNEALFAPREDLDALLATPRPLMAIMAAARGRVPAPHGPSPTH